MGFMTADILAKKFGLKLNKKRFGALTAQCSLGGEKVFLMKPQTYMNLSGNSVGAAARFFKTPPSNVLVVSDDVALPAGKVRVRTSGSAGGHNGLKSIISALGGDGFPRIKIGVGSPEHPEHEMADWVLASLKGQDAEVAASAAERAAEAVEVYIRDGANAAMNRFN